MRDRACPLSCREGLNLSDCRAAAANMSYFMNAIFRGSQEQVCAALLTVRTFSLYL